MIHNWQEDELFGRYEVALIVDTGTADEMLAITSRLAEVGATLGLGFSVQSTMLLGSRSGRREPSGIVSEHDTIDSGGSA